MGFREDRVVQNEVLAREVNESIKKNDTRPASSFIHVACECGLEDCARVLAITRSVYERVRSDPRQFVILPSHLITDVEDVVEESDTFLIVAKRGGTPEDITVRTDPGARDTADDRQSWTIAERSRRLSGATSRTGWGGMGIDRRGSGSCSLQTNNMRIVPAKPDWSGFGGSPRATITRRVASILHWVSSSTCWHRMNGRLLHSTISPAASRRARAEDVVVVDRQRYCNPASTSAVPETASSAA